MIGMRPAKVRLPSPFPLPRLPPMKLLAAALCFASAGLCFATGPDESIASIRAVGREGQGNEGAASGWKALVDQGSPAVLPQILAGMNGANPLAENWLRAAASAIAERAVAKGEAIGADGLAAFLQDTKNSSAARLLAFELIQKSAPGPPTAMAVATPAMLPVPMVADSAVINAA